MRETSLNTGGIFAKSGAEEIFEDMLYEEYSKIAASRGGIGLADMMYRHVRANAQLNISSREAEGLGPVKPGNQQIAMVPNPAASAGR
jgi:Rod binding domain-containing protein